MMNMAHGRSFDGVLLLLPAGRKVMLDWYSAELAMMRKRKEGEVLSSPARKN